MVVCSILWFLYKFFQQYQLENIGMLIGIASLWGLVVMPLYQVGKFLYVPGRLDKVKKPRFFASLAVVAAIVAAVVLVPLPHRVMSSLEIQPRDAVPVYVDVPMGGILREVDVKPGDHVTKGQQLARLRNLDLDLEIAKLDGEQRRYEAQLQNLMREGLHDLQSQTQTPEIRKGSIRSKNNSAKKLDQERLVLRAPIDGTVLPPPATTEHDDPDGAVPNWSGTPLDPENRGAALKESVMFCQIGDPKKLDAVLVLDQGDIESVRKGQSVDIKLDELPHETLHSRIAEIARTELKFVSPRMSVQHQGEVPTTTDPATGALRPQSTSYQARAPLDDSDNLLRIGFRGRGKVHVAPMPLGTWLWRLLMHTFNFKLAG